MDFWVRTKALIKQGEFFSRKLFYLCVVLLILGIFFRCVNLGKKIYWGDETYTSLRISGYTERELRQEIFNGQVIGIEDLQKYQHLNSDKSAADTLNGLAVEEPQLSPLYFLIVRFWAQLFGSSVVAVRSLSVCLSLLALPCLYWLCWELFEFPLVGWVAIALIAISPFHLIYAQEARPYYLFTLATLLSSATLLLALRRTSLLNWVLYTATIVLGLYSHFYFVLVAAGHGLYILVREGLRFTKTFSNYLLASIAAFVAFTPWLWVIFTHLAVVQKATGWTSERIGLLALFKAWIGDLSRIFLDLGFSSNAPLIYLVPAALLLLILSVYSLYFMVQSAPKKVWLFIVTLIGATGLSLSLPDVVLGGQRSGISRYLIPCYLGIELAVAYLFTTKMTSPTVNLWQRKGWQLVMIGVFSIGVLSCVVSAQSQGWWHKDPTYYYPQVAEFINQVPQPLVVSDAGQANVMALSYLLKPEVKFQLGGKDSEFPIAKGFQNVFAYRPSQGMQDRLKQQNYQLIPVYEPGQLWRLAQP
jgi:uncharacterized membrane protein